MNVNLKKLLIWKELKKYIVYFVPRCLKCQQVKDEHQDTLRLLQPHAILE